MDDRTIPRSRWEDTEYISYRLPYGSRTVVAEGSLVQAGDQIAFAPAPPTIVAYADELHVTPETTTYGVIQINATNLNAGDRIGARRSGLRIHTLRAPTDGTVEVIPSIGALTLRRPNVERPIVAAARGTVLRVMTSEIVVGVTVERVRFAFASGMGKRSSMVPRQSVHDTVASLTRAGSTFFIIPHVSDIAALLRDVKARPGPRVLGTVSEEVAWQFLTAEDRSVARALSETPVIVLSGVGRPDVGVGAIQGLGDIIDARIAVHNRERYLTMYRDHAADQPTHTRTALSPPHPSLIRLRDPARWETEGHMLSVPVLGALTSGARTMIVRMRSGEDGIADIPLQNISVKDEP